ncbi:hypothetical protein [Microbacterium aurantiacum]|uniref:hypothetical protein n=1 Tax=Microbacterium aurantiacum TaxID=162393 RepID=UPI000C8043E6|nr:hypothetical protein [Microbacterium aurantiacum]
MKSIRSRRAVSITIALAIASVSAAGLSGCTDAPPAASASAASSPIPEFDPDDTLWTVDSTGEQLELEDADVQALQQVVALHSAASDNRSPSTIVDSVDAELRSFSELFTEKLTAQGYREGVIALYVDNDLSIEQTGVAWLVSTLDEEREHATVGFESIFRIVGASEGYLHQIGVAAGEELAQPREYSLTKIDGTWLIDDIKKGPLRKSAAPGNG